MIVEGVEGRASRGISFCYFFVEFDDGDLLFFADVELIDEFVMYFHEFFLEDGYFVLVLAALAP